MEIRGEQLAEATHGTHTSRQDDWQRQDLDEAQGKSSPSPPPSTWFPMRSRSGRTRCPRRGPQTRRSAVVAARPRCSSSSSVVSRVRGRPCHAAPTGHVAAAARRGRGDVGDQQIAVLVVYGELDGEILATAAGNLERAEGEDDVDVEHPRLPLLDENKI